MLKIDSHVFHSDLSGWTAEIESRLHLERICGQAVLCLGAVRSGWMPQNENLGAGLPWKRKANELGRFRACKRNIMQSQTTQILHILHNITIRLLKNTCAGKDTDRPDRHHLSASVIFPLLSSERHIRDLKETHSKPLIFRSRKDTLDTLKAWADSVLRKVSQNMCSSLLWCLWKFQINWTWTCNLQNVQSKFILRKVLHAKPNDTNDTNDTKAGFIGVQWGTFGFMTTLRIEGAGAAGASNVSNVSVPRIVTVNMDGLQCLTSSSAETIINHVQVLNVPQK